MEYWSNPFSRKSPNFRGAESDESYSEDDKETQDQVVYDEDWSSKLASLYRLKNQVEIDSGLQHDFDLDSSPKQQLGLPERAVWAPLQDQSVARTEIFQNLPETFASYNPLDQSSEILAKYASKYAEQSSGRKDQKARGGKHKRHFAFKSSKPSLDMEGSWKFSTEAHNCSLAQRLQQLIEENADPLLLLGEEICNEGRKQPLDERSKGTSLLEHFQRLVDEESSNLYFNKKDGQKRRFKGRRGGSRERKPSCSKRDSCLIEDEDDRNSCLIDDEDDEIFKYGLENHFQIDDVFIEGGSNYPALLGPNMTTKFLDDLGSAFLDKDDTHLVDRLSKTRPGFCGRLHMFLQQERNERICIEKLLQSGQQAHDFLDLEILEKCLEARLTTCKCVVLHTPRTWCTPTNSEVGSQRSISFVTAIFNMRVDDCLEFDVGRSVRIFSPWREIENMDGHLKVILCTYFSKMLS